MPLSAPSSLADLLRLAPEPCLYLDDLDVHRLLVDRLPTLGAQLTERLAGVAASDNHEYAHSLKDIYRLGESPGDFRIMAHRDDSTMTVKLIGTNEASTVVPDKISVGKLAVVHPSDHHVMALLDVCELSSLRTAMGVALAHALSGLSRPSRLGIVGAGRVGIYTALAFHRLALVDEVCMCDVLPARIDAAARVCGAESGPRVRPMTLPSILDKCDTVVLATTSTRPLIGSADLLGRDIAFLASVGADADNLSELWPDVPSVVRLVVGSPLCLGLGDLRRWREAGLLPADRRRYLHDVARDGDVGAGAGPVCYVSTGFPLLDHVAALLACGAAVEEGRGPVKDEPAPVALAGS